MEKFALVFSQRSYLSPSMDSLHLLPHPPHKPPLPMSLAVAGGTEDLRHHPIKSRSEQARKRAALAEKRRRAVEAAADEDEVVEVEILEVTEEEEHAVFDDVVPSTLPVGVQKPKPWSGELQPSWVCYSSLPLPPASGHRVHPIL